MAPPESMHLLDSNIYHTPLFVSLCSRPFLCAVPKSSWRLMESKASLFITLESVDEIVLRMENIPK